MDRRFLRSAHRDYLVELRALLNRHDPVGLIGHGCPTEEYDPERATIAPKLMRCQDRDEVLEMVYAEFCDWFDDSAGPKARHAKLADDMWQLRNRYYERLTSAP